MKALRTIDQVETPKGTLALLERGDHNFVITIAGRVLMTNTATHSELALGRLACRRLASHPAPRVLIGGLGMGYTLRAVLDELPPSATVRVAELNPVIVRWCRGPLSALTGAAVDDPRVTVEVIDVAKAVARAAAGPPEGRFDAVVIDLYVGPGPGTRDNDPLYGRKAVAQAAAALTPDGIYSVWGEVFDETYAKRLGAAGLEGHHEKPSRGGLRHPVYVAHKKR